MKKTTQTFEIELENEDIIERAIEILQDYKEKDLYSFFDHFNDSIAKYAKDHLEMIDMEDAHEYCGEPDRDESRD